MTLWEQSHCHSSLTKKAPALDFSSTRSAGSVRPTWPMPLGGLFKAMGWSRKRGEAKQQELIGMTAEAEIGLGYLTSTASRIGAERSVDATDGLAPSTSDAFESEDT